MERFPRSYYGSAAPGPGPLRPSPPSAFGTIPMMSSFQSPMPNFKIRIATPTYMPDDVPEPVSPTEPRHKKRRTEDNPGDLCHGQSTHDPPNPPAATSPQQTPNAARKPTALQDGSILPFPAHKPRLPRSSRLLKRTLPRASLTNSTVVYGPTPPPDSAVRYSNGVGDYSSWQGTHAEDQLTETGIRSGYSDKAHGLPVEQNSSRASVLSAIKASGGLGTMSQLLGACLARRGEITAVAAQNTFRPPPRVILTDARKEAWMQELATDNIPLRRLSKTIPHGVRGKHLLEQCLTKAIPVWRAIWLIKCVGSNEIRAFRRKGTGSSTFGSVGESRWIRDWTDNVVETLAEVVHDPASKTCPAEWQRRLVYMLALARRVYEERLVDRDAFHRNVIQNFQAAKAPGTIANWTAILLPYAMDMAHYCHRGRQLLDSLLEKSVELSGLPPSGPISCITDKCTTVVSELLRRHPQTGILPENWQKYQTYLKGLTDGGSEALEQRIALLDLQNAIVGSAAGSAIGNNGAIPAAEVVALCEAKHPTFEPAKLLASCQELIIDQQTLAATFINWAVNPCRPGWRSIFVAVRLIRLLHKSGYDAQHLLLSMLDEATSIEKEASNRLLRLIVELVRSKHFSVSKYLQRRMVRGMPSIQKGQLEILAFLPPQAISPEVVNLATSLCERANCSFMITPAEINTAAAKLDGLFLRSGLNSGFAAESHAFFTSLQPNMKHALILHIRKEIISRRDQQAYPSPDDSQMDIDSGHLYAPPHSIVTILELAEEYPLFADILLLMIPECNAEVLRTIVRCVICHQEVFQAIGAIESLNKAILKRYTVLRQDGREKELISSLVDLMSSATGSERAVIALKEHLRLIVPESAAIAPSPVSDQMIDVLQSQDVRSLADLDSILQSGNVLDELVLQKMLRFLFRTLVSNTGDVEQTVNALRTLCCVKNLNGEAFGRILNQWLDQVFQSDDLRVAMQVVPWIVAGGMIDIKAVVGQSNDKAMAGKRALTVERAPNIFVAALKPPGPVFLNSIEHFYRLKAAQNKFISEEPSLIASLIGMVIEAASSANESVAKRAKQLCASSVFENLFLTSLSKPTADSKHLIHELQRLAHQGLSIAGLLTRILRCDQCLEDGNKPSLLQLQIVELVTAKVNDVNVASYQLLVEMQLSELHRLLPVNERDAAFKSAAQLMLAPSSAWRQQPSSWDQILAGVGQEFAAILHTLVLDEIVALASTTPSTSSGEASEAFEVTGAMQLLSILEVSSKYLNSQQTNEAMDIIQDLLGSIVPLLEDSGHDNNFSSVQRSLMVASRLLGIHLHSKYGASAGQTQMLAICIALGKCLIFTGSTGAPASSNASMQVGTKSCTPDATVESVLVYASSLLSEDMRERCLATLRRQTHPSDRRVEYILGRDDSNSALGRYLLRVDNGTNVEIISETQHSGSTSIPQGRSTSSALDLRVCNIDPWEMLQDVTTDPQDTCLDLGLFAARKAMF